MLFLDGVYLTAGRRLRFVPLPAPTPAALQGLLERIVHRVGRHLERRGLLVRDAESAYLQWDDERASPLDDLLGLVHPCTSSPASKTLTSSRRSSPTSSAALRPALHRTPRARRRPRRVANRRSIC